MGWLWVSSSTTTTSPSSSKPSISTDDKPSTAPSSRPAPSEPAADPEIQKFLELFTTEAIDSRPDTKPSASSSSQSAGKEQSSSGLSSWLSLKASKTAEETPNAPPHDRISESLLPTEMSCRQAFDLAWSCNSLGGQWNAVYRHGEMRSCSEQWDDFWFCMRTKSYTGESKARAVRQYYRNKEHAKYHAPGKPSSEDIWEARSEKLPYGSAFSEAIDGPSIDDNEWRQQESERRRSVRADLGFDKSQSS